VSQSWRRAYVPVAIANGKPRTGSRLACNRLPIVEYPGDDSSVVHAVRGIRAVEGEKISICAVTGMGNDKAASAIGSESVGRCGEKEDLTGLNGS
jgi:hypothetical protein